MTIDSTKLETLLGTMVTELGAAADAALVLLGDKLGLYRALAAKGALTSQLLARETGTHERYVREWLSAQAASGFVTYDPATRTFALSPEQAAVFADDDSPVNGGFHSLAAVFADEPRLTSAFKSGEGVGWGEHCNCLFCGTERFFRPGYKAHLVADWLPALDGVVDELKRGVRVADVGCGHGASTTIMAAAFPNSEFVGIDFHAPSIDTARAQAQHLPNLRFEVASAQAFSGTYDLVTVFDALHDMGDPVGAASNIRARLSPEGTLMLVEPFAHDRLEDNLNPVGRIYYASQPASACRRPSVRKSARRSARRPESGVSPKRYVRVEFSRVRRATETPFNMVLEARA